MSVTTGAKTEIPNGLDIRVLARILEEGYGPEAWHGPNLNAALDDVPPDLAFWRPAPERHNIAEIAIHHAYYTHSVRGRISATPPEPFVFEGDDWFGVPDETTLTWPEIRAIVEAQHRRLAELVADIGAGKVRPSRSDGDLFELVLGITCHAVYHAGQVQLIKRLRAQ
jgi:hypothetical protein